MFVKRNKGNYNEKKMKEGVFFERIHKVSVLFCKYKYCADVHDCI